MITIMIIITIRIRIIKIIIITSAIVILNKTGYLIIDSLYENGYKLVKLSTVNL